MPGTVLSNDSVKLRIQTIKSFTGTDSDSVVHHSEKPSLDGAIASFAAGSLAIAPKLHANGGSEASAHRYSHPDSVRSTLVEYVVQAHRDELAHRNGEAVCVDGYSLNISGLSAVARSAASVRLNADGTMERILASRRVMDEKTRDHKSVYGVTTGFGGTADTRTSETTLLGDALLQMQHIGILPTERASINARLPLLDPLPSTSMPEAWVRGAMLVRLNSLIRGHSAVRWELIERMADLLREEITPVVPLRGSISASGDLSPLSYVAGTIVGNPNIRVWNGPSLSGPRRIVPASNALAEHGLAPLQLLAKEHLGILNGTAFSASVAALALSDSATLALLSLVCTAMGTEAMLGAAASFHPFIHDECRPHPGQCEAAAVVRDLLEDSAFVSHGEDECSIEEDKGELRQDRYPLRTSPQWLGPQIEEIMSALKTVTIECNSTTDNPLVDAEGTIHHGGNFQAMSVTTAMEKTRLALHHIGKLLFAQSTELLNPAMNRGLPPSLAASDPSLNYCAKGLDIATAAYVGELGFLANPVSTHVQSAENHNQAVNSLALISARATIDALQVLSQLMATYLYVLCQALDLRALQDDFDGGLCDIVQEELVGCFGVYLSPAEIGRARSQVMASVRSTLDKTTTMDAVPRMDEVAKSTTVSLFDLISLSASAPPDALLNIAAFRAQLSGRAAQLLDKLRREYLDGVRNPAPASSRLRRTRPMYDFVRKTLGVRMHGAENYGGFGPEVAEVTLGESVSTIYEAIHDGRIQEVLAGMFA